MYKKKKYKIKLPRDFLKLVNKWPKWQDVPVDIKILSPRGCQPLPRGYIRYEKMCIKSDFEFMYLVVSLVVLRAGCGIWLYQFLIIAYLFTFQINVFETCSKWLKWQEVSVDIKILSPGDCQPLSCGYIHLLNHEKMSMKSEVEQMTKVMRPSCWHQNVCSNVLSAPAQGLYTCRKSWKSVHKIRGHS